MYKRFLSRYQDRHYKSFPSNRIVHSDHETSGCSEYEPPCEPRYRRLDTLRDEGYRRREKRGFLLNQREERGVVTDFKESLNSSHQEFRPTCHFSGPFQIILGGPGSGGF